MLSRLTKAPIQSLIRSRNQRQDAGVQMEIYKYLSNMSMINNSPKKQTRKKCISIFDPNQISLPNDNLKQLITQN